VIEAHYTDNNPAIADVVATTTNGAAGLGDHQFDLAVVDEAAQASIPETLIPYACADRLVLIGDDKQLPPFSPNDADQAGGAVLNRSLFEHVLDAYETESSQLLKRQYRMSETIAEFPSKQFYDGKLEHGTKNRNWTLNGLDPLIGVDISGEEQKKGTSPYNETEAECVARRAQRLVNQGVDPASVGVIAMYAAQCSRIERYLSEAGITGVDVSTVDSFQGSERAAIIVSFVRSNATNETGFLTRPGDGPRRLNVAITRARKRLELVGDWETLRTCGDGRDSAQDRSDLYEALYTYLVNQGRVIALPKSVPTS
jgi:superfamily I DNA and/or RNA helicase